MKRSVPLVLLGSTLVTPWASAERATAPIQSGTRQVISLVGPQQCQREGGRLARYQLSPTQLSDTAPDTGVPSIGVNRHTHMRSLAHGPGSFLDNH